MRLITVILLLIVTGPAFAKNLANFKPGIYSRAEGPADKCQGGKFYWQMGGDGVQLGQHGFGTQTSSMVLPSDIPEEAGCNYDVRESVNTQGQQTILKYEETVRCPANQIRHVLTRTATLSNGKVQIQIEQKGNPAFPDEDSFAYQCVFVRK